MEEPEEEFKETWRINYNYNESNLNTRPLNDSLTKLRFGCMTQYAFCTNPPFSFFGYQVEYGWCHHHKCGEGSFKCIQSDGTISDTWFDVAAAPPTEE